MTKASTGVICFFLFSASALFCCERVAEKTNAASQQAPTQSAIQAAMAKVDADKVVAYYFHFTRRCQTCLGIQAAVEKTIQTHFDAETKSGALSFQAVNLDLPENSHFTKDYALSFSSMVVVAKKEKATLKWLNCDKVWELAGDEPALTEYIEKQIRAYVNMLKRS